MNLLSYFAKRMKTCTLWIQPGFLIATFLFFLSVALVTLPQNCLFPLPAPVTLDVPPPPPTTDRCHYDLHLAISFPSWPTTLSRLKMLAAIKANYSEIIVLSRFLRRSFVVLFWFLIFVLFCRLWNPYSLCYCVFRLCRLLGWHLNDEVFKAILIFNLQCEKLVKIICHSILFN